MKALLVVDVQNDFCPGGSLAVAGGDEIIPVVNRLVTEFSDAGLPVVATQDWHPAGHVSFASAHAGHNVGDVVTLPRGTTRIAQVLWPDHCIQGTQGADLHPSLDAFRIGHIVHKGQNPQLDSYSAFFDNDHESSTGLHDWLEERSIDELVVCGLACDYCVKYTALDARSLGYRVALPLAATRAVEAQQGDGERAVDEMRQAGIEIIGTDGD